MSPTSSSLEKYQDGNPVVRFVLRRFFDRLRRMVSEIGPGSVLDAGCGEGELQRRGVLPAGVSALGLDRSIDSLQYCRTHSGHKTLVCGTVEALPFASRSVDVVLCLEVLEHLEQPAAALRELARVAQTAVILSVPYEPYFRIGNFVRGKHLSRWGNHPEHIQHWNLQTFRSFLSSSFSDIQLVEAFPWIIACCRPDSVTKSKVH